MDAHVPRPDGRVVVDDGDIGGRYTQFFADYLTQNRVYPLANLRGTSDQSSACVIVQLKNAATTITLVDLGATGNVDRRSNTNTVFYAPRFGTLVSIGRVFVQEIAFRCRQLNAICQRTVPQQCFLGRYFSWHLGVLEAKGNGIHVHHFCQHVHLGCCAIRGLHITVSSERAGIGMVSVDSQTIEPDVRYSKVAGECAHHDYGYSRSP